MKTVDYHYFLEHRTEKQNRLVEIICKDCKQKSLVHWKNLVSRNQNVRYQQICNKCILKYRSKSHLRGNYYGIKFESSYELGFIHHCIKNKLNIKRYTGIVKYVDENGIKRTYHPDFLVENNIVEIKGIYNDNAKQKEQYAKNSLKNYVLLTRKDLKNLNNFIFCSSFEDLILFDKEHLMITSYPDSFEMNKIKEPENYLGFVYLIKNYLTNNVFCDICIGKATDKTLISLCNNDIIHNEIQIIGYKNFEYDLVHLKNITIEKINNLPRTPTEEENFLYKKKYVEMNSGTKNPMFGNHLNEEQRRNIGEKLKGKNAGSKNGMFGKQNPMFGKKQEKSFTGYDYNLVNSNGEIIDYILNTYIALKRFNLNRKELKNIVINHLPINNECYLEFTERSKKIYEKHCKQKRCSTKNKGGKKVMLFSSDNQLIKEFPTITSAEKELKFNKKKMMNNKLILNDGRYIICDSANRNEC